MIPRITCYIMQVGKRQWERVLDMVGKIRGLNMEVCTTLGMLTPEQAAQLRTAGLTAYNHNLDTSPEYYPKVTSSRKYQVGCLDHCFQHHAPAVSKHARPSSFSEVRTMLHEQHIKLVKIGILDRVKA
jgi:molybdenum cofactor biosynthesis enzyme MoaA